MFHLKVVQVVHFRQIHWLVHWSAPIRPHACKGLFLKKARFSSAHVCLCVSMDVCVSVCTDVCVRTYGCIYIYIYIYICVFISTLDSTISYFYATVPNFLSIAQYQYLIKKKTSLCNKYGDLGKRYGFMSYITFLIIIILINTGSSPENTNAMLGWLTPKF